MSNTKASSKHRKLTQAELMAEATERFGKDWLNWAFQCPNCGDVASFRDFKEAGAGASLCGQECIGRHLGALKRDANYRDGKYIGRGCDWAAYGLFRGPWEVVVPAEGDKPEQSIWSFPLAEALEPECDHQAGCPKHGDVRDCDPMPAEDFAIHAGPHDVPAVSA